HIDTFNPAIASQRQRFVKAVREKLPQVNADDLDAELLKLADLTLTASTPADGPAELDMSCIIRPEQFYTAEVTGLTVPVVVPEGGEPVARWMMHLRGADGRRERRELGKCLELSAGQMLWVHPNPGEPSMNSPPAWSAAARKAWL